MAAQPNLPSFSETAAAAQSQVRPDLQPAVQNFLASKQIAQGAEQNRLMQILEQAKLRAQGLQNAEQAEQFRQTLGLNQAKLAEDTRQFDATLAQNKQIGQQRLDLMQQKLDTAATATPKVHPVPSAEVAKIGQIRSLIDQIGPVEQAFNDSLGGGLDSPFVGPKDARVQEVKQRLPGADAKFANFSSSLAGIKNQILNMLSGAAISPAEYKRLNESLPDVYRNEADFKAKLGNFKKVQNEILQEKLTAFKQAGYDTSGLETGQAQRTSSVASARDAESRYNELLQAGLPEDQVYAKLAEEGF